MKLLGSKCVLAAALLIFVIATTATAFVPWTFDQVIQEASIVVFAEYRVSDTGQDQLLIQEVLKGDLPRSVIELQGRDDLYFNPEVGRTYLMGLTADHAPFTGPTACGTRNIFGVAGKYLYFMSLIIRDDDEIVDIGYYVTDDEGFRVTVNEMRAHIREVLSTVQKAG